MSLLRTMPMRLAVLLVIGLGLTGCDKCGDYFFNRPGACRGGTGPS
jgi:hypothetical protein